MRRVFLLTLLALVFSSPVWATDISGNWALTHTGPMGEENWDLIITAKGNDLTITTQHQMFGEITGTGILDGDNITMTFPTGMVTFEFKGTVEGRNGKRRSSWWRWSSWWCWSSWRRRSSRRWGRKGLFKYPRYLDSGKEIILYFCTDNRKGFAIGT